MKIGLVRHAKVKYRYRYFTTGTTFIEGRNAYDSAQTEITKLEIKATEFPICYTSSQPRAIQTANMIYPGPVTISDDLVEVLSASFLFAKFHLPTLLRKILSRIAWYFNLQMMPETCKQSMQRAERFVTNMLEGNTSDTLIITHGFFMFCLKRVLFTRGFYGHVDLFPKNAVLYLLQKRTSLEH